MRMKISNPQRLFKPTESLKAVTNTVVLKDDTLDMWQMLMHCAIRLNLARIDAENAGAKYDRNQTVYSYFRRKKAAKNSEGERMINLITRNQKTAAYAFDQYFLLFHGMKSSPDANELGQKVREGLEQYGYSATV